MARYLRLVSKRERGSSRFIIAEGKGQALMRRFMGFVVIVLGIILLVVGWESFDSLSSQFSRLFKGSPTDRTLWYFIGGIVAVAVGLAMTRNRRSPSPG